MKLCECGCGATAPLATYTSRSRGWTVGQPIRFIHGHNGRGATRVARNGDRNPNWKGGTRDSRGYIGVRDGVGATAGYRPEHVVIAERVIGHALPIGAVVHHVDENKANNRNSNLVVLQSRRDHNELHRKMRVRRAGGNLWTDRICCLCRTPKNSALFYRSKDRKFESCCIECSRQRARRTA